MSTTLSDTNQDLRFRTLSPEQTQKVSDALQAVLYDLVAFSLLVKQAHWNVIGPNFRAIHLHLDEIYGQLQEAVDSVAERMTSIGRSPNGQAKDVVEASSVLPLDLGFIRDEILVRLVADRLELLNHAIRGQMDLIENTDTVTADLLHGVLSTLEKQHWMLAAQII